MPSFTLRLIKQSGFFSAFCQKLISPKKAETHFTEGKTHFTDGKTHFTDGKTHVLKPKNLTFLLVLLYLSWKVTQIHSKYQKIGHIFPFCLGYLMKRSTYVFVKIDQIGLAKAKNSFHKVPKLISQMPKTHFFGILREWTWLDFAQKKACLMSIFTPVKKTIPKLRKLFCPFALWPLTFLGLKYLWFNDVKGSSI